MKLAPTINLFLLFCIVCDFVAAQQPAYDFSYLQQKISAWIDSGYYKGTSAIIVKEDVVIHEKYFGTYDTFTYSGLAMQVAGRMAKLMEALQIKKAHVVGLSMVSFIGLDFLALHQNRLLSVTFARGDIWGGSPGPSSPWTEEQIAIQKDKIQAIYKKGIDAFKREWFNGFTVRNGKIIEHIRQPIWNMIYKWDASQPTHFEPRFLLGSSIYKKLREIKVIVPVLIPTGDADIGKKNIMELIPSARQRIVSNAGHVSNLENPTDFNKALLKFIRSEKLKIK